MAEALMIRCISVLDKMRISGYDQRPKTQDKLKNALSGECRVIYLSSALSEALSTDKSVYVGETYKKYVTANELESKVWSTATFHAKSNRRNLHALPCDSNLQEKLQDQIREWFDTGRYRELVDLEATAAQCFIVDEDLDPQILIDGLQKMGFLQVVYENRVYFKLPASLTQMKVKQCLDEYRRCMESSFTAYAAKGRFFLAKILSESNDQIKQDYLEKVELYCEEQFAKRYPLFYKERTEEQIRLKRLELLQIDNKANHFTSFDVPQEMVAENWALLPLYLTPEIADTILFLCGLSTKPETLSELQSCLQPMCRITYVASPKCTLPSFLKNTNLQPVDFHSKDVNIFVGMICNKESVKLTDGDKLSLYIKISSKARNKYGLSPDTQSGQYSISPMDTDDAETQLKGPGFENLKNFQKYALEKAKIISRKERASLVFNNEEASIKCKSDLLDWIQSKTENITDNHFITSKELTEKLIHLGLHLDRMPVDTVIKNLEECGYLTISDSNIKYSNCVNMGKLQDTVKHNEEEFLQSFQHSYKASPANDHTTTTSGRKRASGCMIQYGQIKMLKTDNVINI